MYSCLVVVDSRVVQEVEEWEVDTKIGAFDEESGHVTIFASRFWRYFVTWVCCFILFVTFFFFFCCWENERARGLLVVVACLINICNLSYHLFTT